jgi:hypothetical protein
VKVSSEHGTKPSGSIKCWEVIEQLHNWQFFKKCSAPWVSISTGRPLRCITLDDVAAVWSA